MTIGTTPNGLHTPITNVVRTESSLDNSKISAGQIGELGELAIGEDLGIETIPRTILESSIVDFRIPDLEGLADIGAATFGLSIRETRFGTDERIQVEDTSKFPWCAIASLLITAADNTSWIGTAWFTSPRTLITAGHCVYIKNEETVERNGWVKKIQVMPGRSGIKLPYGSITATEFWTVKGWGESGLETCDYGAIILPVPFEKDLGSFGFRVYNDEELLNKPANVPGYPSDKTSGTLWYDNRAMGKVEPEKVYYQADTAGGQSGCPVYVIKDKVRWAVGIHAYGGQQSNSGTRIHDAVFDNLKAWKEAGV
ncbi:endopeptidase [Niastella yeongjuensis]|uniref:Serine protease n=1 Tax=Niastella yeongjuensis TaxID=354355 RepID=A0A1V9E1Q6_9BACT|nr:serine protease [Niastella yeongjuensis]OQP40040.1 endopeptidase [Niastella yeongjuensis]SEO14481.1 V8-like Glu-specific endopeptidase [Niastella yeongjuensis]